MIGTRFILQKRIKMADAWKTIFDEAASPNYGERALQLDRIAG